MPSHHHHIMIIVMIIIITPIISIIIVTTKASIQSWLGRESLMDVLNSGEVFDLGGIKVGPFQRGVCNQGLHQVSVSCVRV
jgi:hypothetical protein